MNNTSFLQKVLISIGAVIVCIFGAYYFLYTYIKSTNEHISVLEQERGREMSRQEYAESAREMLEASNSEISRISLSILPKDGDVTFIEKIESLARSLRVDIAISSLSIENDPSIADSNIVIFNIKAKTTGSWADTYKFISQLELLPEEIQVRRLTLSGTVDDGAGPKGPRPWNGLIEIRVLKYK